MAVALPSSGLLINDPDHAPFGWAWLRGITPVRIAAVAVVCLLFGVRMKQTWFSVGLYAKAAEEVAAWTAMMFVAVLPMVILVVTTEHRTAGAPRSRRAVRLFLAVVFGAAVAAIAGTAIYVALEDVAFPAAMHVRYTLADFFKCVLMGALFAAVISIGRRERDTQRRVHAAELGVLETERRANEARLRLLRVQVEPHFLFNSLASVKLLYASDPREGRALLGNIGRYLRMAIPQGRRLDCVVAEEVDLARAYLEIFRVRMGRRLGVRVEVTPQAGRARIPSMMLATLVENAIKHGIGPRASGGNIAITARIEGPAVELSVADDGVGFRTESGVGVGLANVRAQLALMFGRRASLQLASNSDRGVTATLRVPLDNDA